MFRGLLCIIVIILITFMLLISFLMNYDLIYNEILIKKYKQENVILKIIRKLMEVQMQTLDGYTKKQKIKLAKYENTPFNIIDELIKDETDVKVEVYKRKDFYIIKDMLKNFDEEEYEFFKATLKKGLIDEKIKFIFFKFIFITLTGLIVYTIL